MTTKTTEQLIQEKGLTAPRVTPDDLKATYLASTTSRRERVVKVSAVVMVVRTQLSLAY